MDTDRNVLFGVLALQKALIDDHQFAEACTAWATGKAASLPGVLLERGWITPQARRAVERLMQPPEQETIDAPANGAATRTTDYQIPVTGDNREPASTLDPVSSSPADLPPPTRPRSRRYTLMGLHATGGVGRVWLARDEALGRTVALKDLRPEVAGSSRHRARFLEEAKVTGQLEHPGVVPVYDLVREPEGELPFYAMRFVCGRTLPEAIREYHQKQKDGPAGSLALRTLLNNFVAVCQTLAYAHSRGVLHRDLKPQNVVLGDFGEVIVLDWGLAKVVGQPDSPEGLAPPPMRLDSEGERHQTQAGQILGTPAYMAPEQASGQVEAINPSTDVYGLGAILYEILTGRPPFQAATAVDTLLLVCEQEPTRPRRLCRSVPRALEAICLRALAKKQADRYSSAAALADDVRRWLADEPVSAWREPWRARAARWARRHKTLVASASVLFLSAVVALAGGLVFLARSQAQIEAQRARAEAINKFLIDDLLAEATPQKNARDRKITVEEVLHKAAEKVEWAFPGQPEIEASVRGTIGRTYLQLGLYDAAEPHLRRSLDLYRQLHGAEHPDTCVALNNLGCLLLDRGGNWEEAEALLRESLATRRHLLGAEDQNTLVAMNNLAGVLQVQDKLDEAEVLLRQSVATRAAHFGPTEPITLEMMSNLAYVLYLQGRLTEAAALLEQSLDAQHRFRGPEHLGTLAALHNLALVRQAEGNLDEAQALFEQALEGRRRVLGNDHPKTLETLHDLASLVKDQGWPKEAEQRLQQSLDIQRKVLPPGHRDIGKSLVALGALALEQGRAQEAERPLREGYELLRKALPCGHWRTAHARGLLGSCLSRLGQYDEAEKLLLNSYQDLKASQGAGPRRVAAVVEELVKLYAAWGKPDKEAEWRSERQKVRP
ncbi:MAG TPA: serine/threonine-protein kinase [Gemmataceae bacterium]|nr:serine/threonine-protein kinase [Gemmataceae bacterium]